MAKLKVTVTGKDEYDMVYEMAEALCAMIELKNRATVRSIAWAEINRRRAINTRLERDNNPNLEITVSDADPGL